MKNDNQFLSIDCIRKRLHNLRSQFAREKKALNAYKKSGCRTEEVYIPKLWCFKNLQFLDEGETVRESTASLSAEQANTTIVHDSEATSEVPDDNQVSKIRVDCLCS